MKRLLVLVLALALLACSLPAFAQEAPALNELIELKEKDADALREKGVVSVNIKAKKKTLSVGTVYGVPWVIKYRGSYGTIRLSSSKASVVSVNSVRYVTARAPGKAKITLSCGGKRDSMTITVKGAYNPNITVSVAPQPLSFQTDALNQITGIDYNLILDTNGYSGLFSICVYDPVKGDYTTFNSGVKVAKNKRYNLTVHYSVAQRLDVSQDVLFAVRYNNAANVTKYEYSLPVQPMPVGIGVKKQ